MRKHAALILTVVFLLLCFKMPVSASSEGSAPSAGYIVKLKNESKSRMSLFSTDVRKIDKGIYAAKDIKAAHSISNAENIEFIEPNYYITLYDFPYNGEPNDPRYANQWWLEMTDASGAWRSGLLGRGARVAVIDSGLIQGHEDIDYSSIAYQYNLSGSVTDITDQTGHGSLVTGIIAAQSNNGKGIVGISDEVELIELKCFTSSETTIDKVISAIAKAREQKCDVINMSFGMDSDSSSLRSAIDSAVAEGIIVVAAAGNDGTQTLNYPAAYENVVGVGSVNSDRSVSSFSQRNESVFVTAPGRDITSLSYSGTGKYAIGSGTSFSAPIVSAMAALAKSANKNINVSDFKSLLMATSKDYGAPGYDTSYGYGIVDIGDFMQTLQNTYSTTNNTDVLSVAVSGYPGVWDESSERFNVVVPPGTVPSTTPSSVEIVTEDSGSIYTAVTYVGGLTWEATVTAGDRVTAREYNICLNIPGNYEPAIVNGKELFDTVENAAAPASYDGITAARAFSLDDVSVWFYDADTGDVLGYIADVLEGGGTVSTSGAGLIFIPAATDAEKTARVRVRASDGKSASNPVLANIHVGSFPVSQSILSTASARYDKYAGSAYNKDLSEGIIFYGNTIIAVKHGDEMLQKDLDYSIAYGQSAIEPGSVTIYKSYLDKLSKGDTTLTFDFSAGNDPQLALTIDDTTPQNPVVPGGSAPGGGGGGMPPIDFGSALPLLPQTEFKVTAEALAGGSVSGGGTAVQGADAVLIIKPDDGFEISGVMIDDKPTDIGSLIKNDDGTWSLKLQGVTSDHTVRVEFKVIPQQPALEERPIIEVFSDIGETAWYKDSVKYVFERELFNGTGGGNFSPQLHMTRSMFVSVLGRLSGKVDGGLADTDFTDVKDESWYTRFVAWASENGIVSGYGNGSFGPNDNVSREQMALFLYRYAKWKGIDVGMGTKSSIIGDKFSDSDDISNWAREAVEWAVNAGIVNGKPGSVFDPKGKATRAEVAAIVHRFTLSIG